MPTFRTARPPSIANAFAQLLGSSPNLSAKDLMQAEVHGATANRNQALAEKAMLEVQQMREQEAMRRDPQRAVQYGAMTSGLDVPVADQLYKAIHGMVVPQVVENDDEGNAMPAAPYQRPEGVQPEQERSFRSSIAATMANLLATGKTNANQLAQASGTFNENAVRNAAVGLPADQQNAQVGAYRASAREPFSGGVNAQGMTVNQETGAPTIASQPLHDAAIQAVQNLATQREAQAAAAEARATLAQARAVAGGRGGALPKAPVGFRWTADGDLEPIPGGPKDPKNAPGKPLPGPAVKALSEAGAAVEDTQRLTTTFDDKYGGNKLLGALANTAQRVFGDATPAAVAVPGQAQWWQDMDALQNRTRHDLFGSALTRTELAAWEKTSVTPRMDPTQIRQNLQRRAEIEARAASKLARSYSAGGYNQEQIRETLGVGAQYLDTPAAPATQRGASGSWNGPERRAPARAPAQRVVVDW